MKIETLDQRDQRLRDLHTKRLVLGMAINTRDKASEAIARLEREIAALEAVDQ